MKINTLLVTKIFCLVLVSKASAMFFPSYVPMYVPSTVIIPNTMPDKLSRKWLNWLYAQNSSIISSNDVQSNIDYYHEMIKNHYNYLIFKKENKQIKKIKLKRVLLATAITTSLWTGVFYFINKLKYTPRYESGDKYAFLATSCGFLGFLTFIVGCNWINSLQKHDKVLNRSLKRDEHMLQQFEEYKSTMDTLNH